MPNSTDDRILGHDARGSLMILKSAVRPKIVKAAGITIPATRPAGNRTRRTPPGRPRAATTLSNNSASREVIRQ